MEKIHENVSVFVLDFKHESTRACMYVNFLFCAYFCPPVTS